MHIGILTFHFTYNCGAALQCLALSEYLKKCGHTVEIINYRPWYHRNVYTPYKNPFQVAVEKFRPKYEGENPAKRLLRSLYNIPKTMISWTHHKEKSVMNKKFMGFIGENLQETRLYTTKRRLKKNPPECDIYICGSDQIWNTVLTDGKLDTAYMLDFGGERIKRYAYAVGVNFAHDVDEEEIKKLLGRFETVSLRENEYLDRLRNICNEGLEFRIDIDPTLLHKSEDYEKYLVEDKEEKEPFIITYVMPSPGREEVFEAAKRAGAAKGIKVIDICGNPTAFNKTAPNHKICGPGEFLWYIKNAECIFTNSFHGTVFSVIFKKKFVCIPHPETGYRVKELLEKISLRERIVYDAESALDTMDNEICYEDALRMLDIYKKESEGYLKSLGKEEI